MIFVLKMFDWDDDNWFNLVDDGWHFGKQSKPTIANLCKPSLWHNGNVELIKKALPSPGGSLMVSVFSFSLEKERHLVGTILQESSKNIGK